MCEPLWCCGTGIRIPAGYCRDLSALLRCDSGEPFIQQPAPPLPSCMLISLLLLLPRRLLRALCGFTDLQSCSPSVHSPTLHSDSVFWSREILCLCLAASDSCLHSVPFMTPSMRWCQASQMVAVGDIAEQCVRGERSVKEMNQSREKREAEPTVERRCKLPVCSCSSCTGSQRVGGQVLRRVLPVDDLCM